MKFKLYTKTTCPYCHSAQLLLAENKISFECHSLDDSPELLTEAKRKYNWKTVPMVFDITDGQEKFIGGFTDLKEYLLKGKQLLKG